MTERTLEGPDRLPMAEFGPVRLAKVPRSGINILRQIRTHFDQEEIDKLESAIQLKDEKNGVKRYDLIEPPSVALFNDDEATNYLRALNTAWGTEYSLDDLVRYNPDGNGRDIMVLIAGERRSRAISNKIERDGLSPDSLVTVSLEEGTSFVEAFPRQFIENNARVNPSPKDEAHAIRVYYDLMNKRIQEKNPTAAYTKAACARAFGLREEKVYDALVFTDFPESMQAMADEYPFSLIVSAKEIYDLYLKHYSEEGPSEDGLYYSSDGSLHMGKASDVAVYEVETCIMRLKAERLRRRANPNSSARDMSLKNQAESIKLSFEQLELGEMQPGLEGFDVPIDFLGRRLEAAGNLFAAAHDAIRILEITDSLTPTMRHKLGRYGTVPNVIVGDS